MYLQNNVNFKPKKVLIVSKTTKLQYELHRAKLDYSRVEDPAFRKRMKKRGTNFDEMRGKDLMQQNFILAIKQELE